VNETRNCFSNIDYVVYVTVRDFAVLDLDIQLLRSFPISVICTVSFDVSRRRIIVKMCEVKLLSICAGIMRIY